MDCYFQVKFLVANPFFATSYENIQVCGIFVGVVNNVSVLREAALQNSVVIFLNRVKYIEARNAE